MGKKGSCEIILGSYEEFILGFKYNKKEEEAQQTFAVHSHTGSIRSVANCNDLLASGGSDDRIVIYNLKTRKEHCLLTHHSGTVNCLQFTNDGTHLISGGQDGILAIVRIGNWQLEKVWENAHKGAAILDIALHSSGKLALTLGSDATLRTWNLVKGRQAYIINLNSKSKEPKCLHSIKWAPDGVRFVLAGSKYTDVWSIDTGGVLQSIEHKHKVCSCIWQDDEKLIAGYEDGNIGIVDIESQDITIVNAHDSRVKCMAFYEKKLITVSSTGEIKVWNTKLKCLCSSNAGCRLTCMCIIPVDNANTTENVDNISEPSTSIIELEEDSVKLVQPLKNGKKKEIKMEVVIEDDSDNEVVAPKIMKKSKKLKNSTEVLGPVKTKSGKKKKSFK